MSDYKRLPYKVRRAMLSRAIARHGWKCVAICGQPIEGADRKTVTLEHIIPRSKGGSNADDNLAPAHASCNYSRGNRDLTVKVSDGSSFF